VSVGGSLTAARVESAKLASQFKARIALVACAIGPFGFAVAMVVQGSLPEDTLFGRAVKDSGFALSLVVLGFAALWVLPTIASIVGGDVFAAEDRYGTWTTLLTRSRSRAEVFAGKVMTALAFTSIAVAALALSSLGAGELGIGHQPLIDLSGGQLPSSQALLRVALAWISVVPPAFGFTALAVLLSVTTRSSVAGIGLPVILGLAMQLYALVDGPEVVRRLLITSAFGAWHGLLTEPPFYGPLVHGTIVSGVYFVVCLTFAYRAFLRRDIGG
jgi:ABC-2 type transport system permease protein